MSWTLKRTGRPVASSASVDSTVLPACLPACPAGLCSSVRHHLPVGAPVAVHPPSWEPSTSTMPTTWTRGSAITEEDANKESTHLPPPAHLTGPRDSLARHLFPLHLGVHCVTNKYSLWTVPSLLSLITEWSVLKHEPSRLQIWSADHKPLPGYIQPGGNTWTSISGGLWEPCQTWLPDSPEWKGSDRFLPCQHRFSTHQQQPQWVIFTLGSLLSLHLNTSRAN